MAYVGDSAFQGAFDTLQNDLDESRKKRAKRGRRCCQLAKIQKKRAAYQSLILITKTLFYTWMFIAVVLLGNREQRIAPEHPILIIPASWHQIVAIWRKQKTL